MVDQYARFISSLRLGEPTQTGSLTAVPLLRSGEVADAELLEEGIDQGHTVVKEVDDAGVVNIVTVSHIGQKPLLLLGGEQILGAKQNRVFNASFLVGPGTSVRIPVSCVERGRWRHQSREFQAGHTTLTSTARTRILRRVTRSTLSGRGGYDADQHAVWRDVDDYLTTSRVRSPTGSFADGYASRARTVEQQIESLSPVPDQVGVAFLHGGRFLCLDVLGSPALWSRAWKKLVRGVLAESYTTAPPPVDPISQVREVLSQAITAKVTRVDSPGSGETLHAECDKLTVGGVAQSDEVYHVVGAAPQ